MRTAVADDVIEWLVDGDPAIRWQVMRDLLDAPSAEVAAERERVAETGWGRRLLDRQAEDGRWAGDGKGKERYRGLYSPKWTSTTYTLLLLRRLGLEPGHPAAAAGCRALVENSQWDDDGAVRPWASEETDTCVCAMFLGLFEYFDYEAPDRRDGLLDYLLADQKDDGGWNCDPGSAVGSVHTTISTLEALQLRRPGTPGEAVDAAMERGHEYLLERELFRSRRTGEPIRPEFTRFSFPPRWRYDVLRALDHLQAAGAPIDSRAADAIELVRDKRRPDGTWPLQNRHPGETYFEMEEPGGPSRWNTLRALRVLRWWEEGPERG